MTDGWRPLAGADPHASAFPLAASYGDEPIWIFRTETGFRGVQHTCPHENRTLESARIVGNGKMIRCSYHNYTFKLESGAGVNCPGYRIAIYEVKEDSNALFARPVSR